MHLFVAIMIVFLPSALAAAETVAAAPDILLDESTDFRLGGSVTLEALAPQTTTAPVEPRVRLTLPRTPSTTLGTQRETSLGAATLFLGEGMDSGRDAVQMGTFLSSGQARAGVSITYLEHEEEVSRSEVFLDYSVTERFSVGMSGILNSEIGADEPVPQLGLNAEYSTEGGAFLQGGVADAVDYDPIIGLSIGLRF